MFTTLFLTIQRLEGIQGPGFGFPALYSRMGSTCELTKFICQADLRQFWQAHYHDDLLREKLALSER